jgi:hypothetical protein
MGDDPLSRFTSKFLAKPPPVKASTPPPALVVNHEPEGRKAYEAFDVKDRVEGIAIRRRKGALSHAVMYHCIHSIAFDDDDWSSLHITVSGMVIEIHGRNLRPVAEAIRLRCCDFVQEYRPDRFILPEPVDHNAPFIESISVEVLHALDGPKSE